MAGKLHILAAAALLAAVTGCKPGSGKINGYVEGEYLRIAPTTGGILAILSVERGDSVKAGQPLFSIDLTSLTAARDAAKAELAQAQANWTNLTKGSRPEEIAVIAEQKAQAQADLVNNEKEFQRLDRLIDTSATSVHALDAARAAYDKSKALVAQAEAQMKVAVLGAREDEISAAEDAVHAAAQKVTQAERQLREAAPAAPAAGNIEDTYYRPGEFVAAGAPVVSLLPPENVKVRFFVPESAVATLKYGQEIHVSCDSCGAAIAAKVSFIASQAEYTPPVIYSVESRDKLVFLVEAKPETFTPALRPGLPVDVDLK